MLQIIFEIGHQSTHRAIRLCSKDITVVQTMKILLAKEIFSENVTIATVCVQRMTPETNAVDVSLGIPTFVTPTNVKQLPRDGLPAE